MESPTPDTKDWTWVLETQCPECGFDSVGFDPTTTGNAIRHMTAEWESVLAAPEVAARPAPTVWSPLEYACHVRDVYVLYLARLEMMLNEDDPHYPDWDQDASAIEHRYHESDPARVAAELRTAACALADRFDTVGDKEWQRTGNRSDGAAFTVATFARYFIHDPVHHLFDVGISAGPQLSE